MTSISRHSLATEQQQFQVVLETLITYFLSSFILLWVFLVTQMIENPPAVQETWVQSLGCPWVGRSPWRRERLSTPLFLPGESCEWRSLMGCSPQGRKELDTTERLSSPNLFLISLPHMSFFADIFYVSPDSPPINHMVCSLSLSSFIPLMLLILDAQAFWSVFKAFFESIRGALDSFSPALLTPILTSKFPVMS